MDEVLAVGNEGFQSKCLNKIGELKKSGTAIILVSHNMHTISTFSHTVILMHKGYSDIYNNVADGIKQYRKLCNTEAEVELHKIKSGNELIEFCDVVYPATIINP